MISVLLMFFKSAVKLSSRLSNVRGSSIGFIFRTGIVSVSGLTGKSVSCSLSATGGFLPFKVFLMYVATLRMCNTLLLSTLF